MTETITQGIKISVETSFCGVQEQDNRQQFLFDYFITIENLSPDTVQLYSRHWEIYDSLNYTEIVDGKGVIGQQPILKSGEKHTYRSYCVLTSNCGSMKGYYTMINLRNNSSFKAAIPVFQLQTEAICN